MAAGAWTLTAKAKEYMGNKVIDFDNDTFKVVLCSSSSNISTSSDGYAALTGELSTANGYTSGGATASTPTWTPSGTTLTFDTDNVSWTASGGSIVARFAVMYDDTVTTPTADPIIAYFLLDSTPADVTTTSGNTLTITIANVFQMT